ncbi:hypothetical protein [Streptomyces sp. WM6378]|uniref:hypothetical protein n=1 Tax=Streptomyces sp. WM6378 TaxID=1415557 RepID=UPI0006ADEF5D|nr:hypothetical protein [Streptomyces sp. WM6378]
MTVPGPSPATPLTESKSDREAVSRWLAGSLNRPANAHQEWADTGIAILALGRRLSAVRIAEDLVYAVTATTVPATVARVLREVLHGPVIHDPRGQRFYALVPASPSSGRLGPYATYLGLGHFVGVPRVESTAPSRFVTSYWAAPMLRPGDLCDPIRLASMLAVGSDALASRDES